MFVFPVICLLNNILLSISCDFALMPQLFVGSRLWCDVQVRKAVHVRDMLYIILNGNSFIINMNKLSALTLHSLLQQQSNSLTCNVLQNIK